jgi:hypothetical protein
VFLSLSNFIDPALSLSLSLSLSIYIYIYIYTNFWFLPSSNHNSPDTKLYPIWFNCVPIIRNKININERRCEEIYLAPHGPVGTSSERGIKLSRF